jgi:hypothetical protein
VFFEQALLGKPAVAPIASKSLDIATLPQQGASE